MSKVKLRHGIKDVLLLLGQDSEAARHHQPALACWPQIKRNLLLLLKYFHSDFYLIYK